MKSNMIGRRRWRQAAGLGFAAMLLAGTTACVASNEPSPAPTEAPTGAPAESPTSSGVAPEALEGVIYYMIPQSNAERFEKYDAPGMEAALAELAPKVQFKTINANGESATQQAQVETVISEKPLAVIFGAANTQQSAGMLHAFADANIPVVNYASQADGGPLDFYVTVPFLQIGQVHGEFFANNLPEHRPVRLARVYGDPSGNFYFDQQKGFNEFIDPLIEDGTVEVVCESDVLNYEISLATTQMEQCLTKTNNGVDAVLGMNDGSLTGVAAAISQAGLEDQITIFGGYDATLEAVQRVLAGWQPITLSPPYSEMSRTAVILALSTVSTMEIPEGMVNATFNNGYADIPAAFVENTIITADNVQETIVDEGLFTKEQLCTGIALTSAFCKAS